MKTRAIRPLWSPVENHPLRYLLPWCAIAAGVAFVIMTSLAGFGRGGGNLVEQDFRYLIASGTAWRDGGNPYSVAELAASSAVALKDSGYESGLRYPLYYPPNIAALCVGLSLFSPGTASVLFALINVACCAVLAVITIHLAHSAAQSVGTAPPLYAYAMLGGIVAGIPANSHSVYMGQTSVLAATLAFAGMFLQARPGMRILGLSCIALACIKPQIAIGAILIALRRHPIAMIAVGLVVYLVMAAPAIVSNGFVGSLSGWLEAISGYRDHPYARESFRHFFGLQAIVAAMGIPSGWVPAFGLAVLVVLVVCSGRLNCYEVAAYGLAAPTLLVQGHDYSIVVVVILLGCVVSRCRGNSVIVGGIVLALILAVPLRLVESVAQSGVVLRYRELAALALALLCVWMVVRRESGVAAEGENGQRFSGR